MNILDKHNKDTQIFKTFIADNCCCYERHKNPKIRAVLKVNIRFLRHYAALTITADDILLARKHFTGRDFVSIGELRTLLTENRRSPDIIFSLLYKGFLKADLTLPEVWDDFTAVFPRVSLYVSFRHI